MAHLTQEIEINATPRECFEVISDYESYPEFLKESSKVTIDKKNGNNKIVTYYVNIIKTFSYTLNTKEVPGKSIHWDFIRGDFIRSNTGSWTFKEIKKGVTRAIYDIDIKLGLLVPGKVETILIGSSLPSMLKAVKARVESHSKKKK